MIAAGGARERMRRRELLWLLTVLLSSGARPARGQCTGAFFESGAAAGNGRDRPPANTGCNDGCVQENGRWGASWCYTEPAGTDNRQWGAECAACEGSRAERESCPNSDGIQGFQYTHDGWFDPGYVARGDTVSVQDCANICTDDESCVAFSRHKDGPCYSYVTIGDASRPTGTNDVAYMKCSGSPGDLCLQLS